MEENKSSSSESYDQKYMKIRSSSDDDLPLKGTLGLHIIIIFFRSVFHERGNSSSTSSL